MYVMRVAHEVPYYSLLINAVTVLLSSKPAEWIMCIYIGFILANI
jgi:hypothetical protein